VRTAKSIRKQLSQIIVQGNNCEIQRLFDEIIKISFDGFNEDNCPTLASFLASNLYKGFLKYTQDMADKKITEDKFALDECIKENMIEAVEELFLKTKKRQTKYVSV